MIFSFVNSLPRGHAGGAWFLALQKKTGTREEGKCPGLKEEDRIKKLKLTCIVYVSSHQGEAEKENKLSGGR